MRILASIAIMACAVLAAQAQSSFTMDITINGRTMQAQMADTQAAADLKALLASGTVTVNLHEYGGFERVGALPQSLTADDRQVNARTGDIVLYLGNQIVFMLGSNSWSYTPLGHIDADKATLESFFGPGNSTVVLSLASSSAALPGADPDEPAEYYDLQGNRIAGEPHGLLIRKTGSNVTKVYIK